VFATMEQNAAAAGIIDWAVSQSDLEDVFLRLVSSSV